MSRKPMAGGPARGRRDGDAHADWRKIRIHLLNSPEIEANWFDPDRLRAEARRVVGRRREVVVSVSRDPGEVAPAMRTAHVLVGFHLPTHRLAECPEVRWIHLVSAGVDHLLPLDWLPPQVRLTNSSGVHAQLGGEYGVAALLMLNVRLPAHVANQREGHWEQTFNSPMRGKTVVVVGLGAIGSQVARQAKRLGLRVLGIRRSRRAHAHVDEVHGPEDLPRLLPRADFVVINAPLTPETRHLIGPKELKLLPRGAGLVNMSRAGLVDYDALAERLETGALGGAIIDVCDPEPLPADSPLWRVKHLLITPHVSSDPADYVDRMSVIFLDNLARLVSGRPLRNRVVPARGY